MTPTIMLLLLASAPGAAPSEPSCTRPTYAHVAPPKYPPSAVVERLEGTANLLLRVGTDGKVKEVVVRQSSGHATLDEAATAAAAGWTFNPMVCDGQPRESWTLTPFRFSLDDLPAESGGAPEVPSAPPAPTPKPAITPLRQTPHVVEQDPESLGFSTCAEGERALAQMGLEKHESPGLTFYSGGPDPSRIWMAYRRTGMQGQAIVRLRSSYEDGKAMHRYAVLCEGPDAWCQQLRDDTEARLRTDPPPMPPPPPPSVR